MVVDVADDPNGTARIRLQLPDGWILVSPHGARTIAASLLEAADLLEGFEP